MRFKKHKPNVAEVDMTPMIDIVFQLIAFFMVITNFEQAKADERVKLPRDPLAQPPEAKPENSLVINFGFVRKDEEIVGGPFVFDVGENFTVDQYAARLKREATLFVDGETKLADVEVSIRADADVPTGDVQQIIEYAQEAGFEKFSMSATQDSQ